MDIMERAQRGERVNMRTDTMPWYVTNKDADGFIYRYTISAWMAAWIPIIVAVNALVWGVIGLVVAVLLVIDAVSSLV